MEQLLAMLPQKAVGTDLYEILDSFTAEGMPFSAPLQDINGVALPVMTHAPANLRDFLVPIIAGGGDAEFIIYRDDRLTYNDAYAMIVKIATILKDDFGVKKGDMLSLCMRNYPEWILSYLAIISIGGVVCALNGWWTAAEMKAAFELSDSKLVICGKSGTKKIDQIADSHGITRIVVREPVGDYKNTFALEDLITNCSATTMPEVEINGEDNLHVLYTSGSSGFPKAALSDHRAVSQALFMLLCYLLGVKTREDGHVAPINDKRPCSLIAVPQFHVTGLIMVTMVGIMASRKIILMHKWDVETAYQLIEDEKVTSFSGVPAMSYELTISDKAKNYDLSSLEDLSGGGAARPSHHLTKMVERFSTVRPGIGYGLTETNGVGTLSFGAAYLARPSSVGRATPPLIHIAIMDVGGSPLPTGEIGEIAIRSITNIKGYLKNPTATAQLLRDGWLYTGDMGTLDDEGFLSIVDRKKAIIIRGGENISTLEVEAAISAVDGVKECMVLGLPDERMGELVGAVVYAEDTSEDAIRESVKAQLAAYKCPETIWMVDEPLPKIATGKIDRKSLKEKYVADYKASRG